MEYKVSKHSKNIKYKQKPQNNTSKDQRITKARRYLLRVSCGFYSTCLFCKPRVLYQSDKDYLSRTPSFLLKYLEFFCICFLWKWLLDQVADPVWKIFLDSLRYLLQTPVIKTQAIEHISPTVPRVLQVQGAFGIVNVLRFWNYLYKAKTSRVCRSPRLTLAVHQQTWYDLKLNVIEIENEISNSRMSPNILRMCDCLLETVIIC